MLGWTIAGVALALLWASRAVEAFFGMRGIPDIHPLSTVLFAYTMLRSITLTLLHRGVVWRGTKYPLDELRGEMAAPDSRG